MAMNLVNMLFNTKKIKYDILRDLFNTNIEGLLEGYSNYTLLNLFIDYHDLVKNILSKKLSEDIALLFINKEKINISSNLLNIVAHYRKFFTREYNLQTNIIIYRTDFDYSNKNKITLNNVEINYKLAKQVAEYIPNLYIIDIPKNTTPEVFIKFIKKKYNFNEDDSLNIILTNDLPAIQLTNKNTFLLYLNSDYSKLIDRDSLFYFIATNKVKTGKKLEYENIYGNKLSNIFFSLLEDGYRGTKKVNHYTYRKAYLLLKDLLNDGILENNIYKDINIISEILINKDNKIDIDTFKYNFNKIDYTTNKYNLTKNKKKIIFDQIIDIDNMDELIELNKKYYNSNDQLMLMELFKN